MRADEGNGNDATRFHCIYLLEGILLSETRQPRFCVMNIEEHVFQAYKVFW
jgi:hypothetical protein